MLKLSPLDGLRLEPMIDPVPSAEPVPSSGVTIAPKGGVPRQETPTEVEPSAASGSESSSLSAFGQSLMNQFANNTLALPSAVLDAFTVNPIDDAMRLFRGELPEPVIGNVPRVTVEDIAAGTRAATDPSVSLDQAQQNITQAQATQEAAHPTSTTLGRVTGDVATLLTGRAATGRLGASKKQFGVQAGGLEGALKTGLEKIKKGAGKAVEVGIEGAALATLNEGDPVKAAAMAGGAQAFGSLALTVGGFPFKGGMQLAVSAAGLLAIIQTFKALTPGGRDRILESAETAFEKIGIGGLIGATAGLFGAGRLVGPQISTTLPKIADVAADVINVGARGPWVSFWKNMSKASDEEIGRAEQTLNALVISPEQFAAPERDELQKEIKAGGLKLLKP